jgi:GT2 family glycosyltransferase
MSSIQREPVYIIIPVHNRKQITLQCLKNLQQNGDLDKYYIVVVNDGSTDGTAEAIQSIYPDVSILTGDGNLWWTGGIKKGMEYAYKHGAEYFIWLNDDCYPVSGAIAKLLEICKSEPNIIVGGQSLDPNTKKPSYGGIICSKTDILPIHNLAQLNLECDGLNGNLVCFPIRVIERIGYPDARLFPHYHGDTTYTSLAKQNGYKLLINSQALAFCDNDHPTISWLLSSKPLLDYWQDYFKIKSAFYWKAELAYYCQVLGIIGAFVYVYQRIIKFWSIALLIRPLPNKVRVYLKQFF